MGSVPIESGKDLELSYTLNDGATSGAFPTADLQDDDEATVAGSPFTLVHDANGRYILPVAGLADGRYTAVYKVFTEIGHVTEHAGHQQRVEERFQIGHKKLINDIASRNTAEVEVTVKEDQVILIDVEPDPEEEIQT